MFVAGAVYRFWAGCSESCAPMPAEVNWNGGIVNQPVCYCIREDGALVKPGR